METRRHVSPSRWCWLAALGAAWGLLAIDSMERLHMLRAISALDAFGVAHPPRAAHSPTGYEDGQRDLILPASGMDGYHWIMQTQQMGAAGEARIRAVDFDHAPHGREVHWSSPLRWWLAALGTVQHGISGEPWPIAVEQMAPIANAIILAVLLPGLALVVARRFGAVAAAALVLGMVAVYPFVEAFVVGGPDHHGLALASGLSATLCLAASGGGWVRAEGVASWLPTAPDARRWFIASGVAGAAGVWISAATILPLLVGLAMGGLIGAMISGRGSGTAREHLAPEGWRWWGGSGGAATLGFYLVEYFPADMGWRLEVIHPLYALAWAGGGELMCRLVRRQTGERAARSRAGGFVVVAALAALAAPVVVIAVGRSAVFSIFDPMVSAVPLAEFFALPQVWQKLTWVESAVGISVLPVVAVPMVWFVARRTTPPFARAMLTLLLVAGLVTLVLALKQIRWFGIASAVWLAAAVVLLSFLSSPAPGWTWSRRSRIVALILGAAVVLPYPVWVAKFGIDVLRDQAGVSPKDMELVATREVARGLRARLDSTEPAIVLAGPDVTTLLCYHGGLRGVGTVYWENRDGVRAAAEIFGAPDEATALELIRRRGITHLVVVSWDSFPRVAGELLPKERRPPGNVPGAGFATALGDVRRAPPWLRPVYLPVPEHEYLRDQFVRVYEVVPDQSEASALVAQAWYLITAGRPADALAPLRVAFAREPQNPSIVIALAHAQWRQGDEVGMRRTWTGLRARLGESASPLAVADRINVAVLSNLLADHPMAVSQLAAALEASDDPTLRRLDVLARVDLAMLAREYDLVEGNADVIARAIALTPPVVRARAGLVPPPE